MNIGGFVSTFTQKINDMKNLQLFLFLFLLVSGVHVSAQESVVRLSEPVWQSDDYELFGNIEDKSKLSSPIVLTEAIKAGQDSVQAAFTLSISQVCEKKGCFFVAKEEEVEARITFKDYGFFIPTDATGKEVVIYGTFSKKILTEEQAKHYAEDAGLNPDTITGEQTEYSIVATSAMIPKTK
ncbi:MAG: DUF4920 domain-containing protein [Balneolales bacterium]|nr:DUF4920 domain-containing protein [Balneolales bacterium]